MQYVPVAVGALLSILWVTARVKTGSDTKKGFWRHVVTALGAFIVFSIAIGATNDFVSISNRMLGGTSNQIATTVAALNKNLPVKADDITTMQSVTYEGQSIVYHMVMSEPIPDRRDFEMKKRDQFLQSCMNTIVTNGLRSFGTMTMRYADPQKADAAEIVLRKSDCGL